MLTNTAYCYGLISRVLHWVSAISIVGLFALGLWMVELGDNDHWASHYHESIGILLTLLIVIRVCWRWANTTPKPARNTSLLEKRVAHRAHSFIYFTIFIILISGYFISASDNRGIDIFTWFTVSSLSELTIQQTDIAKEIHYWLSYMLIALVLIHILAALKHHFINKDNTLKRMLYFT